MLSRRFKLAGRAARAAAKAYAGNASITCISSSLRECGKVREGACLRRPLMTEWDDVTHARASEHLSLTAFVGAKTVTLVAPLVTAERSGVIEITDTSVVRL